MSYSKAHQRFSTIIRHSAALSAPQDFLGPNYKTLLDFWWFIESLTVDKLEAVSDRYFEIDFLAKESAYHRASDAANIITEYTSDAASCTHNYGKFRSAMGFDVTYELIAMHIILDKGESLMFIPLFGDL
jgi:hypothetical protein